LNPNVSIIVPVYDEVGSLDELAASITAACESSGHTFETWFIDDGSKDGSWEKIRDIHKADSRFQGVRFHKNYGKSAALAVGFERAAGDYVVTMDADLQDDPAEVPELVAMLEGGMDLVSGWKKKRRDPLSKKIPSRFFNWVTRFTSGIPLHDFNCGLKAYRSEVVKSVRVYGELHRYVPLLAKWEGYSKIGEKVVNHRPRIHGRTKFGFERYIRGFLDLITVMFLTRFAARPMHFFGSLGTMAFAAGFGISLYLSILKMQGASIGNRPLLFLGVLLILLGAQLFLTGLLGEMIIKPTMEQTANIQIRETTDLSHESD